MNPVLLGLIARCRVGHSRRHRRSGEQGHRRHHGPRRSSRSSGFSSLRPGSPGRARFRAGPSAGCGCRWSAGAGIALATIWLFAALASDPLSLALPDRDVLPGDLAGRSARWLGRQPSAVQLAARGPCARRRARRGAGPNRGEPATISREAFRRTVGFAALSHVAYAAAHLRRAALGDHLRPAGGDLALPHRRHARPSCRCSFSRRTIPSACRCAGFRAVLAMGGLDVLALARGQPGGADQLPGTGGGDRFERRGDQHSSSSG